MTLIFGKQQENISHPWFINYVAPFDHFAYRNRCDHIDHALKIRMRGLIAYYTLMHKTGFLPQAPALIEEQLEELKTSLIWQEHEALLAIKQKYNIDTVQWNEWIKEIASIKESYSQSMQREYPNIVHDPAVPEDIRTMIIELLIQNNINPKSINITVATQDEKTDNSISLAQTIVAIQMDMQHHRVLHTYKPATIKCFPIMLNKSAEEKMSLCAHEVQHAVCLHSVTDGVLKTHLEYDYGINIDEFKQTPECHRLCQIYEAQAEILAAINNPAIAQSLRIFRQKSYYPEHLYEEHFYRLSTIAMLWKIHEKLEVLS